MDVPELASAVQELFAAGLAPSTHKAYQSGRTHYLCFYEAAQSTPYPATESTLLLFIAHLHKSRLAHGTIKLYLAAIRYDQISHGLGNPAIHAMPRVEYILKGAKKSTPLSTRWRLPITPAILWAIKAVWSKLPSHRNAKMLWAVGCLCIFGFLRSGEIVCPTETTFDPQVHLAFADVAVDCRSAPTAIQVRIKASKTDPFRQGVTIHIGVAPGPLCPVTAVLSYMVARGSSPGPLFSFEDGRHLTRERFATAVRSALSSAGYTAGDYAGHSFRIGAATTASERGIQDSLIQTLGRWKSSAYTRYIRTAPDTLRGVARTLAAEQSATPA